MKTNKLNKIVNILSYIILSLAITSIITIIIELAQPKTNLWITFAIMLTNSILITTNFTIAQIHNHKIRNQEIQDIKPINEN